MRTTLDIDEELVAEAMEKTGLKTKKAVIEAGLKEVIAKARVEDFVGAIGSVKDFDLDTETVRRWRDQDEAVIEIGSVNEPPVS